MFRDSEGAGTGQHTGGGTLPHCAGGAGAAAGPAAAAPARAGLRAPGFANTRASKSGPPKPEWLKVKVPQGERFEWIRDRARALNLHTVCEEARCPNIGECWRGGTATFMLMGDSCTRGCRFCSVNTAKHPAALDSEEPVKIAETVREMGLDYVVLTAVNRDDLADQGSAHIAETVRRTQIANPRLLIEALIPDFRGDQACLERVLAARPAVLAHNVETVPRLSPYVRDPRAGFEQSLRVLEHAKQAGFSPGGAQAGLRTKSSLMLGLGETEEEVLDSMRALRGVGVDFLTLGQYLQPGKRNLPVVEYVPPERFKSLEVRGLQMGFRYVAAGPLVRSSYRAAEFFIAQDVRAACAPA
ncbi:MAG: lipoyl synthase [SAR324 cluster bacterium]